MPREQEQILPLHQNGVTVIVVSPDRSVHTATMISDKIRLLEDCRESDIVLVARAQLWAVEVSVVSPQRALQKLREQIPASPTGYFQAFGEHPPAA